MSDGVVGFAISRFNDQWQACWLPANKVWRPIDITQEQGDGIMAELRTGIRETELIGFTLFNGNKGWQMSTQRLDENGWSISHIDDKAALAILSLLEPVEHPDGPWRVVPGADWECINRWLKERVQSETVKPAATGLMTVMRQCEAALSRLTAVVEKRL